MITNGIQEYHRNDKIIHARGKDAIRKFIYNEAHLSPGTYSDIKWQYVTPRGKFAKRLAALIKKNSDVKLSSDHISIIGDLARQHSSKPGIIYYDITNKFDWTPGDFKDNGSCFWGKNNEAREIMLDAGGLAIRFYREKAQLIAGVPACGDPDCNDCEKEEIMEYGIGRAWIIPYRNKWALFNSYGFKNIKSARILAGITESDYKNIAIRNYERSQGKLWINNGEGYLVGKGLPKTDNIDLEIGEDPRTACFTCQKKSPSAEHGIGGEIYCHPCFKKVHIRCVHCKSYWVLTSSITPETKCGYCEEHPIKKKKLRTLRRHIPTYQEWVMPTEALLRPQMPAEENAQEAVEDNAGVPPRPTVQSMTRAWTALRNE